MSDREQLKNYNRLVDKLFDSLITNVTGSPDYYQGKIDILVEKFDDSIGALKYKLYICQAVVNQMAGDYTGALSAITASDDARAGKAINPTYESIRNEIINSSRTFLQEQNKVAEYYYATREIGVAAVHYYLYAAGLLALGGIITGISYSMTEPGGTYTVMTGLFLVGGFYFCAAVYKTLHWIARKLATGL